MSKRKLLLADDSITIQKVVNLTFADEGIEVISVGDGNSAMDRLREELPDLVMADVNMPGLNGYEICEKIKNNEVGGEQTPVILLVGSFEPFDEDEARRVGADDYLTKPFQSISQLVEKVSALLKMENGKRDDELEDTAEMPFIEPEIPADANGGDIPAAEYEEELSDNFDDEMIQTEQIGSVPVGDTVRFQSGDEEMADFGMDDEIIDEQTVGYEDEDEEPVGYADEEPEELTAETGDEPDEFAAADYSFEAPEPEASAEESEDQEIRDFNQTQPLTRADFQELALEDRVETAETDYSETDYSETSSSETEYQTDSDDDADAGFESSEEEYGTFDAEPRGEPENYDYQTADHSDDDGTSDEITAETPEEETDTEFGQFVPEETSAEVEEPETAGEEDWETFAADADESEETSETEEAYAAAGDEYPVAEDGSTEDETVGEEDSSAEESAELPMPEIASVLELDEMNLLDLPPLEGIDDEMTREEVSAQVRTVLSQELPVGKNREGSELSEKDISPEIVEAITQKVMDRLSEKAVREIAWEVVPQMADLIIKKLAEEQMEEKMKE